ncbi:MAG: acyltransferase family protein, partial [Pseudomonadota bacterium]
PWRLYLDRKVVHFLYFYVIWLTIQFVLKAPGMAADGSSAATIARTYAFSFLQPFGTLWFIYILPLFFVVTKLLKNWPVLLFALATVLHLLPVESGALLEFSKAQFGVLSDEKGFLLIDEFCSRYVFFLAGYLGAPYLFDLAERARAHVSISLVFLIFWSLANGVLVSLGVAHMPGIAFILGFAGATAIVVCAALMANLRVFWAITWFGAHSIVIYLAFFLPMAVSRIIFLKAMPWMDVGTMALMSTALSVLAPMVLYLTIRWLGFGLFFFQRPDWAVLPGTPWKKRSAKNTPDGDGPNLPGRPLQAGN